MQESWTCSHCGACNPMTIQMRLLEEAKKHDALVVGFSGGPKCRACGHPVSMEDPATGRAGKGGSGGTACFIATAVYGGAESSELEPLRWFRDNRLRPSAAGRALIAAYERLGPALACVVSKHPALRSFLRPIFDRMSAAMRIIMRRSRRKPPPPRP